MKNIGFFIGMLLFVFSACERELENDILTETPPELHVIVRDSDNNRVDGVQVKLFNNSENFESLSGAIASKTTGSDGKAIFTEQDLGSPGIFFIDARKGDMTNAASTTQTPYILLNDGQTYFYTTID